MMGVVVSLDEKGDAEVKMLGANVQYTFEWDILLRC